MGATAFTTEEEKRELTRHFGEEYLMEIFHRETKNWWKERPEHDKEFTSFLKKMTSEMVEKGVGGIISRGIEAMAKKRNIHPRKMMEILVTEDAENLRTLLNEIIETFVPRKWWKYRLMKTLSMECYQAKF